MAKRRRIVSGSVSEVRGPGVRVEGPSSCQAAGRAAAGQGWAPRGRRTQWVVGVIACLVASAAWGWDGSPTPLDEHHLVVVRPDDLAGASARLTSTTGATFDGRALPLDQAVRASVRIPADGSYVLWVRLSQPASALAPVTLAVEQAGAVVLKGRIGVDRGGEGRGGPAGRHAFEQRARQAEGGGQAGPDLGGNARDDPFGDALAAELARELADDAGRERGRWARLLRVETVDSRRPFHWWRVGPATLQAGPATLSLTPQPGEAGEPEPVLFGAAFLSTNDKLEYPFQGDLDAPHASYVRFRIDRLPAEGLAISLGVMHHRYPAYSASGTFGPGGVNPPREQSRFTQTGYTRWFRLQDIETVPGAGGHQVSLTFGVPGVDDGRTRGATQLAVFPHGDRVVRTIPWDAPSGLLLRVALDFEAHPHLVRTHRDIARENYQRAVRATGDRLFPLADRSILFTNGWGLARDDAQDYMLKTLRLLGMNAVSVSQGDAVRHRERYGWSSAGGHYAPPGHLPFDEDVARERFDAHYRDAFTAQRALYEDMAVFQIADEPGEIATTELSSPLWRHHPDASGEGDAEAEGLWRDHTGDSALATRRTDLADCVLEGVISREDGAMRFGVGFSDPEHPFASGWWTVGRVAYDPAVNLAVGVGDERGRTLTRPGAAVGARTRFRIVHQGPRAALYLNDVLVHQHDGLPVRGGFAIGGGKKALHALRIRPIRADERITPPPDGLDPAGLDGADDELAALGLDTLDDPADPAAQGALADRAALPVADSLEAMVRLHWRPVGGRPEAHAGFRRWLRAQGVNPQDLGAQAWDDVQLMTIAALADSPASRRLYVWSRHYAQHLTATMFGLASDALAGAAPNPAMRGFVALSGHALYFPSRMPLDMFRMAAHSEHVNPGVSDWMSMGGWRWDSHQAVAFSVAPYNAGARRYGDAPLNFPMMHCVWPSTLRSHTMLANQVKTISYWTYGPSYAATEGTWSDSAYAHVAVHRMNNRVAQADDIIGPGVMAPSRVAMLWAHSTEIWHAQSAFADRRAAFLALSHAYYQPEVVTEQQVRDGALEHYDALFVLDPWVDEQASHRIAAWTQAGGLLFAAADALRFSAYNEPADLVQQLAGIQRRFDAPPAPPAGDDQAPADGDAAADDADDEARAGRVRLPARPGADGEPDASAGDADANASAPAAPSPGRQRMSPAGGEKPFVAHAVHTGGQPLAVHAPREGHVRGLYEDHSPAWIEAPVGRGRLVYLAHRPGLTYTSQAVRLPGIPVAWADTARAPLVRPLAEAGVERPISLSEPLVMAGLLRADAGDAAILYNMQPRTLHDVELRILRERRPQSVQLLVDDQLTDWPFEHGAGLLRLTLPPLDPSGQMVILRDQPAPSLADRREPIRQRAVTLAASQDREDRSAGLWLLGLTDDRLAPHLAGLKDEHWAIRRASAEALARIAGRASASRGEAVASLVQAFPSETDAHVRSEILQGLGELASPELLALARETLSDPAVDPLLQREAVEAAGALARRRPTPQAGALLADALGDLTGPARAAAIQALPHAAPEIALRLARDAWSRGEGDSRAWAIAIAGSEPAFALWRQADMPGGETILLTMAAHRRDPILAALLPRLAMAPDLADSSDVTHALRVQADPDVLRRVILQLDDRPTHLRRHAAWVLTSVFPARFGADLEQWKRYLRQELP